MTKMIPSERNKLRQELMSKLKPFVRQTYADQKINLKDKHIVIVDKSDQVGLAALNYLMGNENFKYMGYLGQSFDSNYPSFFCDKQTFQNLVGLCGQNYASHAGWYGVLLVAYEAESVFSFPN